jgi:hypothetical protein
MIALCHDQGRFIKLSPVSSCSIMNRYTLDFLNNKNQMQALKLVILKMGL